MDRWPVNAKRVAALAGILLLALMVMDFNARLEELNLLRGQAGIVQEQATNAMQTQLVLQTRVAYAGSDQLVDQWARAEARYVQEGDEAVLPVGVPGALPVQADSPAPAPTPMPNWQVWWELFFGQ